MLNGFQKLIVAKTSDDVMVVNCQFLSHHVYVVWRDGHLCHHYVPMHTPCSVLHWYWSVIFLSKISLTDQDNIAKAL